MTITKFEEHVELVKQQSCEQQDFNGTADEMHSIKDALHSSVQDHHRLKAGLATDPLSSKRNHSPISDRLTTSSIPRIQSASHLQNKSDHVSNRPSINEVTKAPPRPAEVTATADPLKFDASSVLPARTRIRRQRRMESSEAEDPIERLNKLRARISGALSEVKGVLIKYSTETEEPKDEVVAKPSNIKPNSEVPPRVEQPKDDDGEKEPVLFRFVKKVRRRSIFSEDGEKLSFDIDSTEQQKKSVEENTDDIAVRQAAAQDPEPENSSPESNENLNEEKNTKPQAIEELPKTILPVVEIVEAETAPKAVGENAEESCNDNKKSSSTLGHLKVRDNNKNEKRRVSIGTMDVGDLRQPDSSAPRTQRRPSDSSVSVGKLTENALKPFQSINEKRKTEFKTPKAESKPSEVSKTMPENKNIFEDRLSINNSDDKLRRSSIAVVERSKVEPPMAENLSPKYKTERRPSDSAAIIRKGGIGIESNRSLIENNTGRVANNHSAGLSKRVVENNAANIAVSVKNSSKDDAKTPSVADKQSAMMTSIPSIKSISNETLESAAKLPAASAQLASPSLLATVIGSSTTATPPTIATVNANDTLIAPHEKAENSDHLKQLKLPLTADGPNVAGVAAVSNLSPSNATSSQQTQLNKFPNDQSITTNGLSLDKIASSAIIEPKNKESKHSIPEDLSRKVEQQKFDDGLHEAATTTNDDAVRKSTEVKNLIHQLGIAPTHPTEVQERLTQVAAAPAAQQVATSAELGFIAAGNDTCVPENSKTIARTSLSEINASKIGVTANDVATKAIATAKAPNSDIQSIRTESAETSITTIPTPQSEKKLLQEQMPELQLQVLPAALKAVHAQSSDSSPDLHPFDEPKEPFHKKKFKKIVRKAVHNEKQQLPATESINEEINKEPPQPEPELESHEESATEISATESSDSAGNDESPGKPKAERKVKKKVIIKRVQRKLSGNEQSFFFGSIDEKPTADVETIEKAIAYVTDDDGDDVEDIEPVHTINPAKSCMRLREYQVGDLVMYAERYKKTQLRWKKGRVTERITSISYKVDIGGKEVSAHINYLKKYTGRKVRFGDKEYLEIDYEQIGEEETKPQSYSIWNVV